MIRTTTRSAARSSGREGERSRLLHTGFVGRRMVLHRLRRDLNQVRPSMWSRASGGIGKSACVARRSSSMRARGGIDGLTTARDLTECAVLLYEPEAPPDHDAGVPQG